MKKVLLNGLIGAVIGGIIGFAIAIFVIAAYEEEEVSDFSAVQYTLDNLDAMGIDTSKL